MTQGRKTYGVKKKTKRDLVHFIKKKQQKIKAQEENSIVKIGHPSSKKSLEEKLKKPRDYNK